MDPIALLVDAFVKLAERIINLEKTKREDKEQVLKEIIEPLYAQLESVAENYMEIFRQARKSVVENTDEDLSRVLNEIRQSREIMKLARSTVQVMASQIRSTYRDENIRRFAASILTFFDVSVTEGSSYTSRSVKLVDMIELAQDNRIERSELLKFILESLKNMEKAGRISCGITRMRRSYF